MSMLSRVARKPIELLKGVDFSFNHGLVKVKGPKGEMSFNLDRRIQLRQEDNLIHIGEVPKEMMVMAGTARALINNMIVGVTKGFSRKLLLVGVGYRAQMKSAQILTLSLGYSHPIDFIVPASIKIETPSQTEIVITGADKQLVGELAAKIRRLRPPEPYKGKGIRYEAEVVKLKETKKK